MTETQTETEDKIVSIAAFRATRRGDRPMPLFDRVDRFDRQQRAAKPFPTPRSIEHRERMLAFLRKHPASATLTG